MAWLSLAHSVLLISPPFWCPAIRSPTLWRPELRFNRPTWRLPDMTSYVHSLRAVFNQHRIRIWINRALYRNRYANEKSDIPLIYPYIHHSIFGNKYNVPVQFLFTHTYLWKVCVNKKECLHCALTGVGLLPNEWYVWIIYDKQWPNTYRNRCANEKSDIP